MRHVVLVVAAGRGMRAGGGMPKQYRTIGSTPMLQLTVDALLACDAVDGVKVVIGPDDLEHYTKIAQKFEDSRVMDPAIGGATRRGSVRNGLHDLQQFAPDYVHIHDAARPFVSPQILDRLIAALRDHDGAFPALDVVDALWATPDLKPLPRAGLVRAQTPQSFRFRAILDAHLGADTDADDDVAIAVAAGLDVVTVSGSEANFKVTTQADFDRAQTTHNPTPDVRVGNGFDVHAFSEGDHVTLCGIPIEHGRGLKGHSDADVAMHAITDAIYGALAEGDIGQWFPPSDPQWKGAASEIFLRHAMERVSANGFAVNHLDCTIICEEPKIGPHAQLMREELSKITGMNVGSISVKATTSEKLGFTGRSEGIAAQATATLVRS